VESLEPLLRHVADHSDAFRNFLETRVEDASRSLAHTYPPRGVWRRDGATTLSHGLACAGASPLRYSEWRPFRGAKRDASNYACRPRDVGQAAAAHNRVLVNASSRVPTPPRPPPRLSLGPAYATRKRPTVNTAHSRGPQEGNVTALKRDRWSSRGKARLPPALCSVHLP
jgi:hypothetical protein